MATPSDETWRRLAWLLLILLPLAVLFLLPGGGIFAGMFAFWVALILCVAALWILLGMPARGEPAPPETPPQDVPAAAQPAVVREVMDVHVAMQQGGVGVFRGSLRAPAAAVFARLKAALPAGLVPLLQRDREHGAAIALLPRPIEQAAMERAVRPWIHWLLLGLTLLTTTFAGAAHQGVNLLREPERFTIGLPYALGLMTILGVHELGHYFTARRHGLRVTPPFFIPVPFALGTFGAFIQMRSPPESRRALFDVAVAGPLAGLVVAVPALLIGLRSSEVLVQEVARVPNLIGTTVGSSLMLTGLAALAMGDALQSGCVLRLSPLAFAGWLGMLVTALNLLPVGQLDGGHIARGMFGHRVAGVIGVVTMWSLLALAVFVWPGLLLWAIIVFFIAGRGAPPLNDITPINPARLWLGFVAFVILALILLPLPRPFWTLAGLQCPYL